MLTVKIREDGYREIVLTEVVGVYNTDYKVLMFNNGYNDFKNHRPKYYSLRRDRDGKDAIEAYQDGYDMAEDWYGGNG